MARTDLVQRVIAAPLDRVFAALVDPEALTAWLPPDGMSGRFERFDARPGGSYRLVLTYGGRLERTRQGHRGLRRCRGPLRTPRPWCPGGAGCGPRLRRPRSRRHHAHDLELTAIDAGTRVDIRA